MFKPSLEVLEDRTMPSVFGGLPPEINSALMYAGANSGTMLAAAWDGQAAAFAAALASFVPLTAVAADSAQLASLIATTLFGQNTPAITATEAHYMEMWAQDAASFAGVDRPARAWPP